MHLNFNKALVTGGAGFIGSHLVDALLSMNCEVVVIDDLSTGSLFNLEQCKERITFYQGDIRNENLLNKAARGCDILFHQAAIVSVPWTVEHPVDSATVNEMGTLCVLEAARKNSVKRVVLASSSAIYGDDPVVPKHEGMTPMPKSPYAVQKLTGELYARLYADLYDLDTVCLRYFNVYGPRQDPSSPYSGVISIFMAKASAKATPVIYGDGNQYRDFVFVKDAVRSNLLAANVDKARGKTFNIGTGKFTRIKQLWNKIDQLAGLKIEPEYKPSRPGDILESVASIQNAKKTLGFAPEHALVKGLEITFEWYMNNNDVRKNEKTSVS
ncbi:MAG: NAD-dependent epimerase/dehydratase family protein [Deltaproteobacteria bacterium]|nr:NAD-dependent epimerase/dehydratase family protein [Deltaproteobacteria bacterium]